MSIPWYPVKKVPRPPVAAYKQELPPSKGYPKVAFTENLRNRGFSSAGIWLGALACVTYGFYMVNVTNTEANYYRALKKSHEKVMIPILQAEEDLKYIKFYKEASEETKKIIKSSPLVVGSGKVTAFESHFGTKIDRVSEKSAEPQPHHSH